MSRLVKIVVSKGAGTTKSFVVNENERLCVGRGSQSDTKLDDPVMSRQHFYVDASNGSVVIEDAGSSTGTFVNGRKISEVSYIQTGDVIIAGNTEFQVLVEGGSDAETFFPAKDQQWPQLGGLRGTEMGGFLLTRVIGSGRNGLVYEAFNEKKNQKAAVKVFSREFTKNDEDRERFIRGMQAFRKIKDDHLIRLYQAGKSKSLCYAAMELVEGENLSSLINRIGIDGMLDWKEVWKCACHVGSALVAAYNHDVIHRNLVPNNIIRRDSDKAYLLGDFTLAKPIDPSVPSVTNDSDLLGDVRFLPPERIADATTTDTRSDIYGLGATCYALLTGKPPAFGNSLSDILVSIRAEIPPLPTDSHLSVNDLFQSVVMKMIAKSPEERYQSPHMLIKELARIGKLNGLQF